MVARPDERNERMTRDIRTRVSPSQRDRILAAALRLSTTPADFIRAAALSRAEAVLEGDAGTAGRFEPYIGMLAAPVTRSTASGRDVASLMRRRRP